MPRDLGAGESIRRNVRLGCRLNLFRSQRPDPNSSKKYILAASGSNPYLFRGGYLQRSTPKSEFRVRPFLGSPRPFLYQNDTLCQTPEMNSGVVPCMERTYHWPPPNRNLLQQCEFN